MHGLERVRRTMGSTVTAALDLALPAECVGCRREGPPLCRTCRPALDVRRHATPGAALGLPADLPAPLLQLEWCAPFTGITRRALHALKYGGERRLAMPLGEAMAARWAVAGAGGDMLVPVPASPDRVRRRGYDQAALLARVAGGRLGLRVVEILQRSRSTVAQFDLDRAARGSNVAGAFGLAPHPTDPGASHPVRGAWVVLVDDVVTTGATLAACATTLLAAGVLGVSALTVARER